MKTKLIPLMVLCGFTVCALPSAARILLVKTGFLNTTSGTPSSYTLSFDASNGGNPVDKLIVSAGTESAVEIASITYNSVPLTLIPNTSNVAPGRNRGIWYLDNPYALGPANIVVTGTAGFNHMRLGVASISGSAPGAAIGKLVAATSVSLSIPVNDSFVFAAHAANEVSPVVALGVNSPLTQIFSVTGDSAIMAAGYKNSVAAGLATYSFTNNNAPTNQPFTSAGVFVPASASPVIITTVPADNATHVAIGANLVVNFSEPVVAGTGNIELWQVGGGTPLETFNVASSPQLSFSGQTLTINPTGNLTPGVEYYVLIAPTAVLDTNTNAFAGISDPTAWNFNAAFYDDFNDGNDDGWTRLSPLAGFGAPAVFSFPGGNSYQISSPVSPNPGLLGPARAGSLRLDASYAAYFQQSVDIVDWDNSQSNTAIGMLARISQPGLATTDGYSLTVNLNGVFEINRLTNEQAASLVATGSIGTLNPANDYRLVFTGDGSLLTGQIFNLANLSTPLATISGIDATYAGGNSGLFVFTSSGTQTATATFDNYSSAPFGTPIVKADNTDNLALGSSWAGGVAPTSTDRAKWDSTVTSANTTSLAANLSFAGIVITNPTGPVTINPGNTLSLGAGLVDIDLSAATQDLTLNCALSMGAPNVWDVTSGRALALGGVVSGSAGVTKQGVGTAILSSANNYTGGTAITAGTLKLSATGTPGASGASVAVSSEALLDLNATSQSIAFTAGTGAGTVANNSGSGTSTLTLSASPAANVIIADNTNSSNGKVAIVVPVNCSGLSASNTYSGGTTVNAGAFFYNNIPGSAGSGTITLPASGANAAASSGLLVNGGTYANDITGAGYVHINANPGTAVFTGTLNTSGTFNFRNAASVFNFAGSGNSTLSGVIGPAGANGVFGPNITVSTGSIIKSGSGTLTLSGNNLYIGTTTVNAGTLALVGGSQRSPITVADGASLGFTLGSPTTSTSTVNLTNGTVKITSTPTLASYTLMSASSITPVNPVLDSPIPGYELVVEDGKILMLVSFGIPDSSAWASNFPTADLSDPNADYDGDGVSNDTERIFGLDPTNPASADPISVPLDPAAGTLSFTRRDPALTGLIYPVWTSTDLVAWTEDKGAMLTPGAVVNEVQTVAVELSAHLLDEPRLFVRLSAVMPQPPPPLLFADFEDNPEGFTVSTIGGTSWQHGAPNSSNQGGGAVTSGAGDSAKCWGTNLIGGYGANTDTSLRSPIIDLTEVTSASLTFQRAIDALAGHTLTVNVIAEAGDTVIANVIPAAGDPDDKISNWAPIGPVSLPAAAMGQKVRIEWRFVGHGDGSYNGVYIDNIRITVP